MLKVDQLHVARHKVLEGRSQRQAAKELGIARETVRKYLTESIPICKETHAGRCHPRERSGGRVCGEQLAFNDKREELRRADLGG
jgi:transposase